MGHADPGPVEERGGDRRTHAVDAGVVLDDLREPVVGDQDGAREGRQQVLGRVGVEPLDGLDRDRGGKVAGRGAAHTVGDDDEVLAGIAGVVVLLPDPTDVGDRAEPQGQRHGYFFSSAIVLPTRTCTPTVTTIGVVMRWLPM